MEVTFLIAVQKNQSIDKMYPFQSLGFSGVSIAFVSLSPFGLAYEQCSFAFLAPAI